MIIYIIITLLIDNFMKFNMPYLSFNLSFFTPLLGLSTLIFINITEKRKIGMYLTIFLGVIYDVLYSNRLFVNIIIFLFFKYIINKYFTKVNLNIKSVLLLNILLIIMYDSLLYISLFLTGNSILLTILIDKIYHSLLLNLLYTYFSFYLITRYYTLKK